MMNSLGLYIKRPHFLYFEHNVNQIYCSNSDANDVFKMAFSVEGLISYDSF